MENKQTIQELEHSYYVLNKELAFLEQEKQRKIQQLNEIIAQIENYPKDGEKK